MRFTILFRLNEDVESFCFFHEPSNGGCASSVTGRRVTTATEEKEGRAREWARIFAASPSRSSCQIYDGGYAYRWWTFALLRLYTLHRGTGVLLLRFLNDAWFSLVLFAALMMPLDTVKTRLQFQGASVHVKQYDGSLAREACSYVSVATRTSSTLFT